MALSLRCECGRVQGRVETEQVYVRAKCYCRDCQAYARWLDRPGVVDAQGGTDIVATNPAAVHIIAGDEQIACMSLGEKGLLRWYDRGNVPARRYLERFGFEQASTDGDEDERFRTLCMRRQI